MKTSQVCHKEFNEQTTAKVDQQYAEVCQSSNKAFGSSNQNPSSEPTDEGLNSVSSVKIEGNQKPLIPLYIFSLLIFLVSPFIGGVIVNVYSPQNGSWGCPGLIPRLIFWGISGFIGAILGILSLKDKGSPLAFFATLLNTGVAIFVFYIFIKLH